MSNEFQQIIVYRNPLEAALWNSTSSNPDVVLGLIIWMVVAVPIIALMFRVFSRFDNRDNRRYPRTRSANSHSHQQILLVLGCVISAALTYAIMNFALI